MRFDGSPFPGIVSKEGSIHPHLGREKAHDIKGHCLLGTRKPTFILQARQSRRQTLVITHKSSRRRESGLLDDFALQILSEAKNLWRTYG